MGPASDRPPFAGHYGTAYQPVWMNVAGTAPGTRHVVPGWEDHLLTRTCPCGPDRYDLGDAAVYEHHPFDPAP